MNQETCLDPVAFAKLEQLGGRRFACEMIDIFLSYVPEKLAEARAAELAGDIPGIQKAVHPIKSSAGNLGAFPLKELAARIEQLARSQQGTIVPPLLRELEAGYAQVARCLQEKRRELAVSEAPQ
jgi:HPt (histidine-containing phosphotransfer) domain-containing protein